MLRYHRSLLPSLTRDAWTQIALGIAILPVNVGTVMKLTPDALFVARLLPATGALMTWNLIFGTTGLALRWAHRERPWVRYMTDASSWMYLVHMPLMLIIPGGCVTIRDSEPSFAMSI